ncbi:uncharacterized protein LOC129261162 [Lytechinus pictus]|uniref:uncharacterized protein LOC129261162 n=1 Tax=Lytechinus pictus TaxID=7653 RepID=UPI0030BA00F1
MIVNMRVSDWYIVALASLAVETVLSTKVAISSCPIGHYAVLDIDGSGLISDCLVCDSCSPGYGVSQDCSPISNTVCLPCSMGTFSTTVSATDRCEACSDCRGRVMAKECSPISDSVCGAECSLGEYFDPTSLSCKQCSYCFPGRPFARTARVLDCQRQGLDIDYQCSPLPGTDAIDVVHPRVVTADRHRSATAAKRHHDRTVHTSSRTQQRTDMGERKSSGLHRQNLMNDNGKSSAKVAPSTIPLVWSTQRPPLFEATTTKSSKPVDFRTVLSSAKSPEEDSQRTVHESRDKASKISEFRDTFREKVENGLDAINIPKTGKQGSIIPYYHSMTSTDIVILVVIVIIVMLISIMITAMACYCWIWRGKSLHGHKVMSVSAKPPTNAWTYQDMMPSMTEITEMRPLVKDTPPPSRKLITCV